MAKIALNTYNQALYAIILISHLLFVNSGSLSPIEIFLVKTTARSNKEPP